MQEGSTAPFQSGSGGPNPCQPQSTANITTNWASYNASNQMTGNSQASSLSPDAAGNMTYDGNNQYLYDAEGRICALQSTQVSGMTVMT
jgi:hypothetical protein